MTRQIVRHVFSLLMVFFFLPGTARSQGPPINTDTAIISGIEGAALRSFLKYTKKSGDGELTVLTVPVVIPYELLPNRLLFVGKIPYQRKERKTAAQRLSSSGFGDLSLTLKYLFYQKDALKETTRAVLSGGIKLPTGDDGKPGLSRPLQDGSGSYDYHAGIVLTHVKERIGLNADIVYTLRTESNGFRFGDTLRYDLAFGYRLIPAVYRTYPAKQLNLYVELNGIYAGKDTDNGAEVAGSGGSTIFLSPGIQFIPGSTFLVEASFQIPVWQDLNGNQLETDYAFLLGFRWLIL